MKKYILSKICIEHFCRQDPLIWKGIRSLKDGNQQSRNLLTDKNGNFMKSSQIGFKCEKKFCLPIISGVGGTAIPKVLLPESAIPYYAIVGNHYCRKPLLCSLHYYPIVLLWIRWEHSHMHFKHAILFLLRGQSVDLYPLKKEDQFQKHCVWITGNKQFEIKILNTSDNKFSYKTSCSYFLQHWIVVVGSHMCL